MKKAKGPLTPKQQKIRKVFSILANVLGAFVVIVTLLISIVTISRTQDKDTKTKGISNIFGYAFMPVLTDSMNPEFKEGDLIITKLYNGDGSDLNENSIITFREYIDGMQQYNTHRIVERHFSVMEIDGAMVETDFWFRTRGDNNPKDINGVIELDPISRTPYDIVAKYTGIKFAGLGQAITKLQTDPTFYFLVVVLPLILLFVIYVFFFVKSIVGMKLQKTREEALANAAALAEERANAPKVSLDELSDDEKLKLLLELQAKQKAKEQNSNENGNDNT